MSTYKRILIVSNECFSSSSSNGRTLMNFFKDYDKESMELLIKIFVVIIFKLQILMQKMLF